MPLWLVIVLLVLLVLIVGGMLARRRQLSRTRATFERVLEHADRDLAAASAQDRGWDRRRMETAARRAAIERLGDTVEDLQLIEVLDRPGTDEDEALFRVRAKGRSHTVALSRRGDDWVGSIQA